MSLIFLKILNLLKRIPSEVWLLLGYVVFIGVVAWFAYNAGQDNVQAKWDSSVQKERVIANDLVTGQKTITLEVEAKFTNQIAVIREKGATIEKEIPVFIPSPSDTLPGGFRLLHDASATNTLPDRSQIPFASPVSIADVASTVNANYTTCFELRQQVLSWQEWYHKNQDEYQRLCKQKGVVCKQDIQ